ncbi:FeGP cofactor biosynthesis guanylyltransferase HcgB family protein [Methanopyrus sp. KOL6]|uniref:FeGP cofactor biosynthesis guanylyltransferase HcgB family protein n=1 Tax=Methanopyrus sp. KOL6 TaxID=1937004 RepID=UPI000B4B7B1D|nr:FeGP cofactor biosynthesis guanylyltransferase HcgB family protein [Methanopyrus sp. KOL6]
MLRETLLKAWRESWKGTRRGDKKREVERLREYLTSADRLAVVTGNENKLRAVNRVLRRFGLSEAEMVRVPTEMADATLCPAIFKAIMGVQASNADVVIARGRLGVPGSGAMTVFMDARCRLLTAALSPPHVIHEMSVEEAMEREVEEALRRLGMKENTPR